MKTTIDLPDELLIAAKKKAAEDRTTLRAIFERGLRRELGEATPPSHPRKKPARIRWVTVPGKLHPDLNLASRAAMYEWLRKTK